ncbi:hypothetical protein BJY04DRAFT_77416 [Aspergillus karnatakaensis]|uniref:uncharacterized protein n=1 Tax=Aspergillus karnatakaensis TaxID=1810916 RepID=UPI003CCD03AC
MLLAHLRAGMRPPHTHHTIPSASHIPLQQPKRPVDSILSSSQANSPGTACASNGLIGTRPICRPISVGALANLTVIPLTR